MRSDVISIYLHPVEDTSKSTINDHIFELTVCFKDWTIFQAWPVQHVNEWQDVWITCCLPLMTASCR